MRTRKKPNAWLTVRTPVLDVIEDAQPPMHMSCDWLGQFDILIFPRAVYERIRELKANGN